MEFLKEHVSLGTVYCKLLEHKAFTDHVVVEIYVSKLSHTFRIDMHIDEYKEFAAKLANQ